MNKTELTVIVKEIELPRGWKVLGVYPKMRGRKRVAVTDRIVVGCPIGERMSLSGTVLGRRIGSIVRQLNALRPKYSRRWEEFGTGFGGGEWYDIDIGIGYSDAEYDAFMESKED